MNKFTNALAGLAVALSVLSFQGCALTGAQENENENQLPLLALFALASDSDDSSGGEDLAQPANDTALMILNGEQLTMTNSLTCTSGGTGVGFRMIDADNLPTLFIHNIDFAQTSGVSVGTAGSVLDIDLPAGVANPSGNCPATVKETTAAIYDIQVLNCALNNGSTVSFRARCTP